MLTNPIKFPIVMADFDGGMLSIFSAAEYKTYQQLIARSAYAEKIKTIHDGISEFFTEYKLMIFANGKLYYQIARKSVRTNRLMFLMLFRIIPLDNPQPATEIMK